MAKYVWSIYSIYLNWKYFSYLFQSPLPKSEIICSSIRSVSTASASGTGSRSQHSSISVQTGSSTSYPTGSGSLCTVKVLIPKDTNGSIVKKSFPIKPGMTVKQLSRMIAHKIKVTNAEDCALFILVEGKGKKYL